jgi:cysteinyl-tRNA synthetase
MLKIYNSLTRKIEDFKPANPPVVTMYTCGPTVYDYQHIGNLRTATLMDTMQRALTYLGYNVKSAMNVTDVEDKIENAARERGKKISDITKKYEKIYFDNLKSLNISVDTVPHASKHIKEQIALIKVLEEKGYTYKTEYGLYFDVSKDKDYGKLGNTFKSDKAKSRIATNDGKKNPEDFVLWRLPLKGEVRQETWESPWGKGYPGWHIECSAMSYKTLTNAFSGEKFDPKKAETIDIHVGGSDLREVHHENEVAQSESCADKQFVKYWVHGGMLVLSNEKMSKSLNNFFTLKQLVEKGFEPLSLRYLYFTGHYRKELNFSWETLKTAQQSLKNLRKKVANLTPNSGGVYIEESTQKQEFLSALADDINMPKAMAVVWDVVDNHQLDDNEKVVLLKEFDTVVGLDLFANTGGEIPKKVFDLVEKRDKAREQKDYKKSDELRDQIKELGFEVEDSEKGTQVYKI